MTTPTALHLDVQSHPLSGDPVAINFTDALGRPVDPPESFTFPESWFTKHPEYAHLVERVNTSTVVRPALADPGAGEDGVLTANPNDAQRHVLTHAERIIFHTAAGDVSYTVDRQPDKYLADAAALADPAVADHDAIADPDARVTAEAYAEGLTVVVHNYQLTREA